MPDYWKHSSGYELFIWWFAIVCKLKGFACENILEGVWNENYEAQSQQSAHLEYVDYVGYRCIQPKGSCEYNIRFIRDWANITKYEDVKDWRDCVVNIALVQGEFDPDLGEPHFVHE